MAGGLIRRRAPAPGFPWFETLLEAFHSAPDAPEEPIARIKDPWPGDAGRGEALIANEADLLAALGPEPRDPALIRDDARRARAHGFAWLRDLRSLGGDAARRTARRAVTAWIETNRRSDPVAWRPDIVGQRLSAWMGTYDFFAASAGPTFRGDMMELTVLQVAWLKRRIAQAPAGPGRFAALAGLAAGAAAIGEAEAHFGAIEATLARAAREDILGDGGLDGASPAGQLDALMRLLDLRAAAAAVGRPPPEASGDAAMALAGSLAALRAGDGGLCVFGGGEGDPWAVDLALAASGWRGRAAMDLPASGYARALAGRAAATLAAQSGALELSHGQDRLLVSLGAVADAPTGRLAAAPASAFSAPAVPGARLTHWSPIARDGAEGATLLEAAWRTARPDVSWRRRVYLAADGHDVRGEDMAEGPHRKPAAVVFHLHPGADAIQLDERSVLIRAASGQGWRFRADAPVAMAPEPYRGRPGAPAAGLRLELPLEIGGQARWAFRMEAGA